MGCGWSCKRPRPHKSCLSGATLVAMRYCVPVLALLTSCSFAGLPQQANAQHVSSIKVADTSSPRATLQSFIESCNELHVLIERSRFLNRYAPENREIEDRILDCIDASNLPAFDRANRTAEVAAGHKHGNCEVSAKGNIYLFKDGRI